MLISVTGPECSGKTTLTDFLKRNLDVTAVDEFARNFLSKTGGQYTFADLDTIALGQVAEVFKDPTVRSEMSVREGKMGAADEAKITGDEGKTTDDKEKMTGDVVKRTVDEVKRTVDEEKMTMDEAKMTEGEVKPILDKGKMRIDGLKRVVDEVQMEGNDVDISHEGLVVTDTFLLVIVIWSLYKYGKVSVTVQELYDKHKPDFYLLCKPDIPWEDDVLRENPHGRGDLFKQYLNHIRASRIPYFIVDGLGPERMPRALQMVVDFNQKNYLSPTKLGA